MSDEDAEVVDTMARFGGSFVKALAECFRHADPFNFRRLRVAFPEFWQEYEQMAARHKKQKKED